MKAIILAGGQATRLRPITHDLPKCLLTVGKKTILDFQLDTLIQNGVTDIIIVTGFKADAIKEHVAKRTGAEKVTFIHNDRYETTRAAYGLWVAREQFTEPVIYLNSDLLCDPLIFKKLIKCPQPSATAIHRNSWDEEEVNVVVDEKQNVVEIGKLIPEEKSWGEFIGATKFSKEFLDSLIKAIDASLGDGKADIFAADGINSAINDFGQTMYALDVTEHIAIEIDTIQDFEDGKLLWKKYEDA
ncbi:MAG: phosphocholine cytidylyltransferase family protein [Candidatus Pacebacteria bacterium]|nr:phosphocholine cytidylyltransferase family protein [Candidatus Paceibacterota bacterium]